MGHHGDETTCSMRNSARRTTADHRPAGAAAHALQQFVANWIGYAAILPNFADIISDIFTTYRLPSPSRSVDTNSLDGAHGGIYLHPAGGPPVQPGLHHQLCDRRVARSGGSVRGHRSSRFSTNA